MTTQFIAVNEPLLDGNEKKYLQECIDTGWISSEGPFVERLERDMAGRSARAHGVAVCNGTAALQIAIEALDLPEGSEVIVPSFTIMSCVFPIVRLGLKPVPVDCDPLTFNSDVSHYEAALTKNTSAIMIVHLYGLPVDVDPILDFAKRHNLRVIEDAAEMIGQTYDGRPCGGFGDVSIMSFYPNKHITTGEGGMVLTNDAALDKRLRALRNLAFDADRRFRHHEMGWNYRMTNLQAAVGCAQIENLDRNVRKKREIGAAYNAALAGAAHVTLPVPRSAKAENIYWVYSLVLGKDVEAEAAQVMAMLGKRGIGCRPFFYPAHQQPVFQEIFSDYASLSLPNSEFIARKGFYIPSGLNLTGDMIARVSEMVRDVLQQL